MPQNLFTGNKATYYDPGSPEMWDPVVLDTDGGVPYRAGTGQ